MMHQIWNSHKAEGAVGNKEKFLPLTGQPVQHSVCLVSSENVFLWGPNKQGKEVTTGSKWGRKKGLLKPHLVYTN